MNSVKIIQDLGRKAKSASILLANISTEKKNLALNNLKFDLNTNSEKLIEVNKMDLDNAVKTNLSSALISTLLSAVCNAVT